MKELSIEEKARLWTIQDAKDGDVLATLDYILIFKKLLPKDGGVSYCHYDFGSSIPQFNFNKDDNWYFGKKVNVYPATKEQRDLLFKKMHEAGYEWDAEKKELKKIEQKPAWSEEDKGMLLEVKCLVDTLRSDGNSDYSVEELKEMWDWLDTIWQRVEYPQPKQEWNEEDESLRRRCIGAIDMANLSDYTKDSLLNWLKSLSPQNRWKPSDEQIEALKGVQEGVFRLGILESLYQDLKKLREE